MPNVNKSDDKKIAAFLKKAKRIAGPSHGDVKQKGHDHFIRQRPDFVEPKNKFKGKVVICAHPDFVGDRVRRNNEIAKSSAQFAKDYMNNQA